MAANCPPFRQIVDFEGESDCPSGSALCFKEGSITDEMFYGILGGFGAFLLIIVCGCYWYGWPLLQQCFMDYEMEHWSARLVGTWPSPGSKLCSHKFA